jgi:glutathione S-transferase
MAITIHGVCASPYVRKVFVVAEILGLEFENNAFSPLSKPENYTDISPLGKIPALTDGDLNLADSSVICDYLNNKYGNNELYPTDPVQRAKALWLEKYADTKLVEGTGAVFFERVLKPKFMQQEPDQSRVDDILTNVLPPIQDYLESQLLDSGFALGEEMTIADVAITTQYINASYAQVKVDVDKWPKLAAYVGFMMSQPCFVKRMTQDAALFA